LDNIQVYLSGPWHPAAKARVKNLYFRKMVFVTKPKLPGEVEGEAEGWGVVKVSATAMVVFSRYMALARANEPV
jgi:hypothetical protein